MAIHRIAVIEEAEVVPHFRLPFLTPIFLWGGGWSRHLFRHCDLERHLSGWVGAIASPSQHRTLSFHKLRTSEQTYLSCGSGAWSLKWERQPLVHCIHHVIVLSALGRFFYGRRWEKGIRSENGNFDRLWQYTAYPSWLPMVPTILDSKSYLAPRCSSDHLGLGNVAFQRLAFQVPWGRRKLGVVISDGKCWLCLLS